MAASAATTRPKTSFRECYRRRLKRSAELRSAYPPVAEPRELGLWLANASPSCSYCSGTGRHVTQRTTTACKCVLREVARACVRKYRYVASHPEISTVRWDRFMMPSGKGHAPRSGGYGRRNEEFTADVWLLAKGALNPVEWQIFQLHELAGKVWHECCAALGLTRGDFFHAVYAIEMKLGHIFLETQPYRLFPIDEYFGGA